MNCKPGDLAVLVRAFIAENSGRIVRVIRPAMLGERLYSVDGRSMTVSFTPAWIVSSEGSHLLWGPKNKSSPPRRCMTAPALDIQLRPIRDNPGEDETLTWAPRKESV